MRVVGLTGGVGMGKSTVAAFLRSRGEPVIDTDEIAREVVAPGSAVLEEVRAEFGESVMRADGSLDRSALAREVFGSETRRRVLEGIVHPKIRQRWKAAVEVWRQQGKQRSVVVIPLLYETAAQGEFHRVVCVACSAGVQIARLRQRAWSDAEIRQRLAAQWPVARKMDLADGVIWNESTVQICEAQAARLFDG